MEHWLAQLRKQHNLTQVELAARVKVHPNVVSRIERGISMPSYDTLTKLCEIFGTDEIAKFLPTHPGNLHVKKVAKKTKVRSLK